MPEKKYSKQYVIPRQDAVFWMDDRGYWRNEGGKFRNKKIIDHFHASIAKDQDGYFVSQLKDDILEKVYFRYDDTALFVFSIIFNAEVTLVLNTEKHILLNPEAIYIRKDNLYIIENDERIKFSERALFQIATMIEEDKDQLLITLNGKKHVINPF